VIILARHLMRMQKAVIKTLRCTECGGKREVVRRYGKNRPLGHTKLRLCTGCKKITAYEEVG